MSRNFGNYAVYLSMGLSNAVYVVPGSYADLARYRGMADRQNIPTMYAE